MSRTILFHDEARDRLKTGIDLVADTVKVTLGPRGRNVVLDTNPYANPVNTNDGVTIAREIHHTDEIIETGAKLVKAVAEKTNDVAGDGTTTASLLVQAIVTQCLRQMKSGADPVLLRKGIERATDALLEELEKEIIQVDDLQALTDVATISCGDEKIGSVVADAVMQVGADGVVTIEDSEGEETTSRIAEGIELRGGVQLPVFITNRARQEADVADVPIFVTDHDLTNGLEVIKLMESWAGAGYKQGIVIANNITGEAMASAVVNAAQQKFMLIPIKVMAFGEQGRGVLEDVAAATGATFFAKDAGHKLPLTPTDNYDKNIFGHADRIVASKDRTTILGGKGEVEERVKELKAQLPNLLKEFEKNGIKERIAKLQSGVGVIRVGGVGETERNERKLRVEDAINATKAAYANGVVIGGGATLYRVAHRAQEQTKITADDQGAGMIAVVEACFEPIKQMAANSSIELHKGNLETVLSNKKMTIDFNSGQVVDGVKAGIIDPALVARSVIKNAASEAGLFIVTEAVIADAEDKSEKV